MRAPFLDGVTYGQTGSRSSQLENKAQAELDDLIDQKEEQSKQGCHDEYHDCGDRRLAACGPNNFGNFGADLFKKLDRVHLLTFINRLPRSTDRPFMTLLIRYLVQTARD